MKTTRKFAVVRLGQAKKLTRGGTEFSIELNMQPKDNVG